MKLYKVAQISVNSDEFYICPFCKWVFFGREYMVRHMEERCPASPQAASCATCGHRVKNDEGAWVCGDGQIEGELFAGKGTGVTGCCRHYPGGEECYYTRKLKAGDKITPKGYNKEYLVLEVEEDE
jgi:hypothetical protein